MTNTNAMPLFRSFLACALLATAFSTPSFAERIPSDPTSTALASHLLGLHNGELAAAAALRIQCGLDQLDANAPPQALRAAHSCFEGSAPPRALEELDIPGLDRAEYAKAWSDGYARNPATTLQGAPSALALDSAWMSSAMASGSVAASALAIAESYALARSIEDLVASEAPASRLLSSLSMRPQELPESLSRAPRDLAAMARIRAIASLELSRAIQNPRDSAAEVHAWAESKADELLGSNNPSAASCALNTEKFRH